MHPLHSSSRDGLISPSRSSSFTDTSVEDLWRLQAGPLGRPSTTKGHHLRRRLVDLLETPEDSLVRESSSATSRSQPQTSQDLAKARSFHSRKRLHVCARACARAHKHARLSYLLNGPPFGTRQRLILIRISLFLPSQVVPHDTLPHLACCHKRDVALTGRRHVCSARKNRCLTETGTTLPGCPSITLAARRPAAGASACTILNFVAILNLKS